MCYDIKASLEAQLNRARRLGDENAIKEIEANLVPYTSLPIHHASGFQHPKLLIYTDRSPYYPEIAIWGLVPFWVKDKVQLQKLWNNTINARGETIFEKPSFKTAAKHHRCMIYVDGFYEHHHFKTKTYPFFIHFKNNEPMPLAGLYSEWTNPESGEIINTFSIVTTIGNTLLRKIHNNPKLKGPRMPLILNDETEDQWLREINDPLDETLIKNQIQPFNDNLLEAFTVPKLRGKDYLGNVPETAEPFKYAELEL